MDTHFVVGYKGDEMETQEHEKTLKEQLIKDFEQMSQDELDLLDQSYRFLANKKQWQTGASLEPIIQEPEVITTKNSATKFNGQNTQTYPEDQMEMSGKRMRKQIELTYFHKPKQSFIPIPYSNWESDRITPILMQFAMIQFGRSNRIRIWIQSNRVQSNLIRFDSIRFGSLGSESSRIN